MSSRHGRRPVCEALEPRVLYSADLNPLAAGPVPAAAAASPLPVAQASTLSSSATTPRTDSLGTAEHEAAPVELAVIDHAVAGAEQLVADMQAQQQAGRTIVIVRVESGDDGIEAVSSALSELSLAGLRVSAVHLIGHGDGTGTTLGATRLDLTSLRSRSDEFAAWSQALTADADMLLYGCEIASDARGLALVQGLSQLTGADVAASDDLTGAAALGGDWALEHTTGAIETSSAVTDALQLDWNHLLATFTVTNTNDSGAGSLRQAITNANASFGADTVQFNIGGGGVHTINLLSALPTVNEQLVIDATTQPGYSGTPLVELNGTSAGAAVNGITVASGNSTISGLAINRFDGIGIYLTSGGGNTLTHNFVGTDATGTLDLGNNGDGIYVDSANNIIGTGSSGRNLVSGNAGAGVVLSGAGATGNIVRGNYLGVNATGTASLGNSFDGVTIWNAGGNFIGGVGIGQGNLVSGNLANGIGLYGGSMSNEIYGNYVGVSASGASALGNAQSGFSIDSNSSGNQIGGALPGQGNVISGNTDSGIWINDSDSTTIQGNLIGRNATDSAMVGNGIAGIFIQGATASTLIGGANADEGNVIAGNGGDGVMISGTGIANSVRRNSIYLNSGLGIDLNDDGVTANDLGDGDGGPNLLRNFPVLTSAQTSGADLVVVGNLNSTANQSVRVEFFATPAGSEDPSGYGEGTVYLGFLDLLTDGFGDAVINTTLLGAAQPTGTRISATTTRVLGVGSYGSTSEFSMNVISSTLNTAPSIAFGEGNKSYTEAGAAIVIDASATLSDTGQTDFGGGHLLVDMTVNGYAFDAIEIRHQGMGAGQVGVSGTDVYYGGTLIGSFSGSGAPLDVLFNTSADATAVQAVMRNITFRTLGEDPSTLTRTVRFRLDDGDGGNATAITKQISVFGDRDLWVTTASDTADGNTSSIDALLANRGADNAISLREAIAAANNTANAGGPDLIYFDIAGAGVHTINLGSALPQITESVVIDGYTQTGATANSAASGTNAQLLIELNGTAAGPSVGLELAAGSGGSSIAGLVINRFATNGIAVYSNSNTIVGNFLGVDATGSIDRGNGSDGIYIDNAASNQIGSSNLADRNLISGNNASGVFIAGAASSGNLLQGNLMGTDAAGLVAIANFFEAVGMGVSAHHNLVGGTGAGEGNVLAYSGSVGVALSSATGIGNAILGNSIYGNVGGSGIDLQPWGQTGNDAGDVDSGPNSLQNYPTLTSARTNSTQVALLGSLSSLAGDFFRIEFFASATGDASGFGEGARYLGFVNVSTNGLGIATINTTLTAAVAVGEVVSATATRSNAAFNSFTDTSEFAQNVTATSTAGITVTPTSGGVTTEAGGATTFSVVLDDAPSSNVTINLSLTDSTEGSLSTASLTFNAGNWSTPQIVTVTGVDDTIVDGNVAYSVVTAAAVSLDGRYSGLNASDVSLTNNDNDTVNTLYVTNANDVLNGNVSSIAALIASDGGDGISLREAITAANNTGNGPGGADRIHFNIAGAGIHTISLLSALPNVTGAVQIDASTEPGYAGTPLIELDGTAAGSSIGFRLDAGSGGSVIRGFIINRFADDGIRLSTGSDGNIIEGNWIGLSNTGNAALGNGGDGIRIDSGGNQVGGNTALTRNVISGNGGQGIDIDGASATLNLVSGNYIGTSADGLSALGNSSYGIELHGGASFNAIGASGAGGGNVVSGNLTDGLRIDGAGTDGNSVVNNFIGVDATGLVALGNSDDGIQVNNGAADNQIGDGTVAGRNIVSGNLDDGIQISNLVDGTIVQGNFIGTAANGVTLLGNVGSGVRLYGTATNNWIGGAAAGNGNLIAGNGGRGVFISDATDLFNKVLGNSIHSNSSLGIDLGSTGVTANDVGDVDTGANDLQNFPVLTSAVSSGGNTTISGSLNSQPSSTYRLEFFSSATGDGSSHGEGQVYLGFANVNTDGTGSALFAATLSGVTVTAGHKVSATATVDLGGGNFGGTSEFAQNTTASGAPPGITVNPTSGLGTTEAGATDSFTVVLNSAPSADVVIALSSSDLTEALLSAAALTFTAANWNLAQTVTVSGVDDTVVDGTIGFTVFTAAATSADPGYNGLNASDVTGVNTDDDTVNSVYVDTVSDTSDGDTSSIAALLVNRGADARISLREAITAANNTANAPGGADRILFSIADPLVGGSHTIQVGAVLPAITDAVVIDGGSEPDFAGVPVVVLDGSLLPTGSGNSGLSLAAGSSGSTLRDLVIGGFGDDGILIWDSSNNLVAGNRIGVNATGTVAFANAEDGIVIGGLSANNVIGGTGAADRNIISGNTFSGINLLAGSFATLIQGNYIGTNAAGSAVIANGAHGVSVQAGAHQIGGSAVGAGNVISGNPGHGLDIHSSGNLIVGNFIGLSASGTVDLSNGGNGIMVDGGSSNTIGGLLAGERNSIVASGQFGIGFLNGSGSNVVLNNTVGTTANGAAALGSTATGIHFYGTAGANTVIGGSAVGAGNIVTGSYAGIDIQPGANNQVVQGNNIGLNATQTTAIGGSSYGIIIGSQGNQIGGTAAGAGNVLSGNSVGLLLAGATAASNVAEGNFIGTDSSGLLARANSTAGVEIAFGAHDNTIGGTVAGSRNIISGNASVGVWILSPGSDNNIVLGNSIGVAADGTTALGNQTGVLIDDSAANSRIGGLTAAEQNLIAFNSAGGVTLTATAGGGHAILSLIHGNGGLAIDLGADGVTANDALDADGGPNGFLNTPVIESVTSNGSQVHVVGSLDALPSTSYRILFCTNVAGDPSGYGEAQTLLGSIGVLTDAGGHAAYVFSMVASVAPGLVVSAIAVTDLGLGVYGDTSEMAANVVVQSPGLSVTPTSGLATDESGTTATFSIALLAQPIADVVINLSVSDSSEGSLSSGSLTFTSANWNVAQVVTVTGVDDAIVDGSVAYSVVTSATVSADSFYNGSAVPDVSLTNTDDDLYNVVVVDTTSDLVDGDTSSVGNLLANRGADGFVSLREAVEATNNTANSVNGPDRIRFAIAGVGGHTISLTSALPDISDGVFIDGWTQPGWTSAPLVELDGSLAGVGAAGLWISGSDTTVRGLAITGFDGTGILLVSGADNVVIHGNYIGLDLDGVTAQGNQIGVRVSDTAGTGTLVGGAGSNEGNVIAGNITTDVQIAASGSTVQGNRIGTSADGGTAIAGGIGIRVAQAAVGTLIGGTAAGQGNQIVSASSAILVFQSSSNTVIEGNRIQTDVSGTVGLGTGTGILVDNATNTRIGGTLANAGNIIAFSSGYGVSSTATVIGLSLFANSIHGNAGLGIDLLGDGVTLNAPADGLVDFPVLSSATTDGSQIVIDGTLAGVASRSHRIEFFSSDTADGSGHGEGRTYLGFVTASTDATGNLSFSQTLAVSVPAGRFISATATDMVSLNTSEFALNVVAALANQPPSITLPSAANVLEDTTLTLGGPVSAIQIGDADAGTASVQVSLTVSNGLLTLASSAGLTFSTGTGSNDLTMTFTGALADINAALDGLQYRGSADFNGADNLQVAVDDLGNTGNGGARTASANLNITVNPANDGPSLTLPPAQTVAEEQLLTLGGASAMVVGDIDAGAAPLQVTLSATSGVLSLSGTAGLSFTVGSGNNNATMTFTGSLADINTALNGLSYRGNLDFAGSDSIVISVNDQGNTGAGGALNIGGSVSVTVTGVNDAPVVLVPAAQSTGENTPLTLTGATAILVTDVDAAAASVQVSLSVANGTLSLSGTTGLGFVLGSGSNDRNMTFTGTLAAVNAALDGLVYRPDIDYNGADTLNVGVDDLGNTGSGGALTGAAALALTVTAVNNPPQISVPPAQSVAEDATLVLAGGSAVVVSDVDAASGNVQVDLSVAQGRLSLSGTAGLTFVTGTGTLDTSLRFTGTLAAVNAALDGLSYLGNLNFNGADLLSIGIDDLGNTGAGGARTASASVTLNVSAVNDAPTLNVPPAQTVAEDGVLILSGANAISVADVDAGGGLVEIDLGLAQATLTLASTAGLTFSVGTGSGDSAMRFSGSLAAVNAALDGLVITTMANFNGADSLAVSVSDLGNTGSGGAAVTSANVAVTVSAVNDAPQLTGPTAQSVAEDGVLAFGAGTGNALSINDLDAAGAALRLTLAVSQGTLSLGTTAGLTFQTGTGSSDATMVVTGSQASLNAALQTLTYRPGTQYNGTENLFVQISDQGNTGAGGALSSLLNVPITVDAVNDAPTLSAPATQSLSEDTPQVFSVSRGNAISLADVDALGLPVRLSLSAQHGQLNLATTAGLTFVAGAGLGSTTIVVEGTTADLNAALDGLVYLPDANYNGSDTIALTVDDRGNTGSGTSLSVSHTIGLSIAAVNDPPSDLIRTPALVAVENSLVGTSVGDVVPIDVDDVSGFAYVLLDDAGHFRIDPVSGALTVASPMLPDFVVQSAYRVVVEVTDPAGGSAERSFLIQVVRREVIPPPPAAREVGQVVNTRESGLDRNLSEQVVAGALNESERDRRFAAGGDDGEGRRRVAITVGGISGMRRDAAESARTATAYADELRRAEEASLRAGQGAGDELLRRGFDARRLFDLLKFERMRAADGGQLDTTSDRFVFRLPDNLFGSEQDKQDVRTFHVTLESVQMGGVAVSIGLLFYALRAGGLVAAMLTALPAWSGIDPLVILAKDRNERRDAWDDDLATEMAADEAGVRDIIAGSTRIDSRQFGANTV